MLKRKAGSFGATANSVHVWIRYGRVGVTGVPSLSNASDVEAAIRDAKKKTRSKMSKGYTEIKLATEDKVSKELDKKMEEKKEDKIDKLPSSKLPQKLQDLINFIFDSKMMEQSVVQVGYDIKRLPLG